MPGRTFTAFVVTLGVLGGAGSGAQQAKQYAFTNVSVATMDSARVLRNQTVVVSGDRITAIGPARSTTVPAGAERIDGQGKYLMPGLAEMHGHIPPPSQPKENIDAVLFLYVARGVTTVRGMQGAPGQLELREAARRGDIVSPTLYLAGPAFSGGSVKSVEDAVARVKQQKSEGWDLIKVLPGLSLEVYDAMAKSAKEAGMRFAGHVPAAVGIEHAIEMGQDSVDHLDGYAEKLDGLTKPVDARALQELVAKTKKAGTWMVPTMFVWETLQGPVTLESRTQLPELKYLPASQIAQWTQALQKRLNNPQFNAANAKIYMENRDRILKALHDGGVGILLGSDAPQQFNVPGFSIHREMKSMADAGMGVFDIVKSGTASVGQYFKGQDAFGTVGVGKRADLILVDGNPLESLANIEKQSGVMVRGRWLPKAEIDKRLAAIAGRK